VAKTSLAACFAVAHPSKAGLAWARQKPPNMMANITMMTSPPVRQRWPANEEGEVRQPASMPRAMNSPPAPKPTAYRLNMVPKVRPAARPILREPTLPARSAGASCSLNRAASRAWPFSAYTVRGAPSASAARAPAPAYAAVCAALNSFSAFCIHMAAAVMKGKPAMMTRESFQE